jgi:tRNA-uridine 2-sulfurtransferase
MNWLGEPVGPEGAVVHLKMRSAAAPVVGTIIMRRTGAVVKLSNPEPGIAPGQACVAYSGNHILGGGWIVRAQLQLQAQD